MSILAILNEIAADNSRNYKESVLAKHADNDLLKRACYLAYDPMVQFYQRKIPAYSTDLSQAELTLENAMICLDSLSSRQVTGNEAIRILGDILSHCQPDDAKVIEKIVLKDFDVGIADSTILKTWPGLLSKYPILLTSAFKYKLLEKLIAKSGKKYAQLKSDGARANIHIRDDGTVAVFSRQGREIFVRGHFDWLGQIEALRGYVLDGELLARDPVTRKPMPRKTGNGLVNKAIKGTLPENQLEILYLTAWDIISLNDFQQKFSEVSYGNRFSSLNRLVSLAQSMHKNANIELIESREIETVEDAIRVGQEYIDMGCEGAIIKHGEMLWGDDRSKLAIKIKAELECDLIVKGIVPGEGKYAGMIGSLYCETSDGLLGVCVSGLTDDERAEDPENWIGSVIGVLYNEKIKAKKRKPGEPEWSLFLPRIHPEKRRRIDKTVADSLDDIE
jgi:ATP-dependent DNA ligase